MARKFVTSLTLSFCAMILSATTVFAGTWTLESSGWKWKNDSGSYSKNCWQWCDGNGDNIAECYYFDENGYCLLGTTTPDGYKVNSDGAWIEYGVVQKKNLATDPVSTSKSGTSHQAISKAAELGGTLKGAYDWCAGGGIKYTADWALNDDLGIRHYANRGFSTGEGDCYDMACCLCEMARALGYEANAISGYVPLRSGGKCPHCWCEIIIDGITYVFDPDFQYEKGTNGYMINYGQKGTWKYHDFHTMHD